MEPGALHTFTPYRSEQLAPAIAAALEVATDAPDPRVQALAGRLSTTRVMDRYVGLYRKAAAI
jgi:hypothetical protein